MDIKLTLRVKGVVAVLILIGYLALIGVFVANERSRLVPVMHELENRQFTMRALEPAVAALAHAVVDTQAILNSPADPQTRVIASSDPDSPAPRLEQVNVLLEHLRAAYPGLERDIAEFRLATGSVLARPTAQHLARMGDSAQILMVKIQEIIGTLQRESAELEQRYQAHQQFLTVFAISANVLGAAASVAVILVFFTRLAGDIDRLQNRAVAIVAGYDGPPLPNARGDEVGGLIDAVNRMQVDLRNWERQEELTRQQRFHQEKMAAVGSVASAIGHEVANPIAAISGIAQFIADDSATDDEPRSRKFGEFARQILGQTQRISHILRQLGTLTAPPSAEPELLDLNALVRSTCGFIRFDKRFRSIQFEEALDPELPAITAVSDHITQVLVNLLINAADAFDGCTGPCDCTVRVVTRVVADEVHLSVTDNGHGMAPDVLAKAFEESFTTKPAGKGRGIGLFVCRSLVEKDGGRIELSSVAGEGTTATVRLPLEPARPGER